MSTDQSPPAGVSPEEFARWTQSEARRVDTRSARRGDGIEFADLVKQLGTLPPETAEEKALREEGVRKAEQANRMAGFKRVCPPEFMHAINRTRLVNPVAFDAVAGWDGRFPGPLCTGATGTAKTRAAWSAIGRLVVNDSRTLAWFPVKRMLTELVRYESKDLADEFWRNYRGFHLLFVDDIDKINWQFESECAALFQFYDWIYRERRPCITTTNKDREWWAEKMGDAFARRLFDDAHRLVQF